MEIYLSAESLDLITCALIRQQTELRSRLPIMQKFASPQHLANHEAKITLGEKLLANFTRNEP
jgi:hypothetical protein